MVWGTDNTNNRIVGLNPTSDTFQVLTVPANNTLPYSLTVGPDNTLWFTMLANPPRIGVVTSSGNVDLYSIPGDAANIPVDIAFQNSTVGYFVALDTVSGYGNVYQFNPSQIGGSSVNATIVGGKYDLYLPNSISLDGNTIWVTQHGAGCIASYNTQTNTWTQYPTSQVSYISTTLPYFVYTNGSVVWFNEHYGNRMVELNTTTSTMTEFSDSTQPASSIGTIDNALTLALASNGVWFAATTPNFIGFLSADYQPPFSISLASGSNNTITLQRGGPSQTISFDVQGQSSASLRFNFTDSESYTTTPLGITLVPSVSSLGTLSGEKTFSVSIAATQNAAAGNITALIAVTDGVITSSMMVYVHVSSAG